MHDEIDLAPLLLQDIEHRIDRRGIRDVAMAEHEAAEVGGERLDPLLQRVALIGERDLSTGRARCLRDAPGEALVIGEAHDQPALALHQT